MGCQYEMEECYIYQQMGLNAGLEFGEEHCTFFVIDPKTNKFIVPYYGSSVPQKVA